MTTAPNSSRSHVAALWALTAVAPLVCVFMGSGLYRAATGRPSFAPGSGMAAMWTILVGLPFLVLATLAPTIVRKHGSAGGKALTIAAAAGFALAVAVWGLFYYDGYAYWKEGGRGGANIGLGLLLFASPLLVGIIMGATYRIARRLDPGTAGR